jgi:hypothetical protein
LALLAGLVGTLLIKGFFQAIIARRHSILAALNRDDNNSAPTISINIKYQQQQQNAFQHED